jgi:hypothetical protein
VRQKLTRVIADRDGGLVFDAGSLTVGKYLKQWLETSVRGTVRTSTFEVHRHMIQPHIVPDLGRLKLKDLNPVHVRTFYREKLNSGLSAATVRKIEKIASREGISKHCLSARAPRYNRAELDAWLMGRRGAYHLGRSSPSTRPPPPWNSRWRP